MKYVVPDMAQSFGTFEFAGESEPVFERDKNNRRVLARRSYNLYSDVQKGENVVVAFFIIQSCSVRSTKPKSRMLPATGSVSMIAFSSLMYSGLR